MFIDENDVRTPRDRRFAEAEGRACGCSSCRNNGRQRGALRQEEYLPTPALPREGRGGLNCRGEYQGEDVSLAMVYSPYQHWRNLYDEVDGFARGTIFRELDKPFEAYGNRGGCCI